MPGPAEAVARQLRRRPLLASLLVATLAFAPFLGAAIAEDGRGRAHTEADAAAEAEGVAAAWRAHARGAAHDLALLQAFWRARDDLGEVTFQNLTATMVAEAGALSRVTVVDDAGVVAWTVPPSAEAGRDLARNASFAALLGAARGTDVPVVSGPLALRGEVPGFVLVVRLTAEAEPPMFAMSQVRFADVLERVAASERAFAYRFVGAETFDVGDADAASPWARAPLLLTGEPLVAPDDGAGHVEVAYLDGALPARAGLPAALVMTGLAFATAAAWGTRRFLAALAARARAREALAVSEHHYRALFEEAGEMILVVARDGRFKDANPRTRSLLGRSLHDLQRLRLVDVVVPEDHESLAVALDELHAEDGERRLGLRFVDREGELVDTFGTLTAHSAFGGDIIVQAHLADVTRLRTLERELDAANRALKEKVADLDAFAHTVAHDLKSPIRAVASMAEFLEEDAGEALSRESRRHLENIRRAAERMKELVDAMLLYARSGAEGHPVEMVDVRALAEEAVEDLTPLIQERRARVSVLTGFPELAVHRVPLKQVFYNLVANAIRHNPRDDPEVVVSAHPGEGETWEFSVHDNGPGIPEEAKERVFRLFERTSGESGGSGVGLSIVQRVVAQHLGRVWVENDPEGGATFTFTIGRLAPEEAQEETLVPEAERPGRS